MKQTFSLLVLAATLVLSVGCNSNESEEPAAAAEWTHTIKLPTDYYKGGPQQASPPDGQLASGVKVKIVQESGSYTLISTEDGVEGYVSADALEPIAP